MIVNSLLTFMILNVYKLVIVYIWSANSHSVSFYEKRMKNANLKLSCEGGFRATPAYGSFNKNI